MHGKEVIEKHSYILSVISSTLKAEKNNQLSKLSVGLKKKKKKSWNRKKKMASHFKNLHLIFLKS